MRKWSEAVTVSSNHEGGQTDCYRRIIYYSLLLIKFVLLFKVIKVSWDCSLEVECFLDIYKALDLIPALEESPEPLYQGLSASTVQGLTLGSVKLKGNSPHFLRQKHQIR